MGNSSILMGQAVAATHHIFALRVHRFTSRFRGYRLHTVMIVCGGNRDLVGAPSTAAGSTSNWSGEGRTVARSLSPDIYDDVATTLAEASNSVVYTLPGEMTIDLVTREISIDLQTVED